MSLRHGRIGGALLAAMAVLGFALLPMPVRGVTLPTPAALPTLPVTPPLPTLPVPTLPVPTPTFPSPPVATPPLPTLPPASAPSGAAGSGAAGAGPSDGSHGGIPPAASGPAPAPAAVSSAGGRPAATGALADVFASSPQFAASVDAILRQPFASVPPDLQHFRLGLLASVPLGAADTPVAPRSVAPGTAQRIASSPGVVIPAILALLAALAVTLLQRSPALRGKLPLGLPARGLTAIRSTAIGERTVRLAVRPLRAGSVAVPLGVVVLGLLAAGTAVSAALVAAQAPDASTADAPALAPVVPSVRTVALEPGAAAVPPGTDASASSGARSPAGSLAGAGVVSPPGATTARATSALPPSPPPSAAQAAAAQLWAQLMTVEATIATDSDRITVDESTISRLTAALAAPGGDRDPRAAGQTAREAAQLQDAVSDHDRTQADYHQSLQREYDLYRQAAADHDVASALLATAATFGQSAIRDSVTYDLQVVLTQLVQDQSVAAAETATPAGAFTGAPGTGGLFSPPMSGVLTQRFGPTDFTLEPPITYDGTFYPHFHTGVDLAAPAGTPVASAADGVVILAASSVDGGGHLVGYGNYVVVQHAAGYETLYGHMSRLLVRTGDRVRQGQPVGLEGSAGWSTGPHLHFEIRKNRLPIDGLPLISVPAAPPPTPSPAPGTPGAPSPAPPAVPPTPQPQLPTP